MMKFRLSSQTNSKCKWKKKKRDFSHQLSKIKDISIKQRQSLQSLSCAVSIPKSTLCNICKERKVLKHISSMTKAKPSCKKKLKKAPQNLILFTACSN